MKKSQQKQGSLFFPNGSINFSFKIQDCLKGESDSHYPEKVPSITFQKARLY